MLCGRFIIKPDGCCAWVGRASGLERCQSARKFKDRGGQGLWSHIPKDERESARERGSRRLLHPRRLLRLHALPSHSGFFGGIFL